MIYVMSNIGDDLLLALLINIVYVTLIDYLTMPIIKKEAFNIEYGSFDSEFHIDTSSIVNDETYHNLRQWQSEGYCKLVNEKHWFVKAPTGAGKSVLIQALVWTKLLKNPKLKAIIAVPQKIITQSFDSFNFITPDGFNISWQAENVTEKSNVSTHCNAQKIINMLQQQDSNSPADRIMVCCHQSLVNAFTLNKRAFKNVLLVIDEIHHSECEEFTDIDVQTYNRLGQVINHVFEHASANNELGISTATFFRGNRKNILPLDHMNQIVKYEYAFDEFIRDDCGFESFGYDFLLYGSQYKSALDELFNKGQPFQKTIIHIPPVNSIPSTGKNNDVQKVYQAIANCKHPEIEQEGPVTKVKRNGKWIKIINFVNSEDRADKKEYVKQAHKPENADMLDAIIALNMFKEGANWRWATQGVIIGFRKSATEQIQIMGRLIRPAPDKRKINFYQVIQFNPKNTDEQFNDYLKTIYLAMLFEDIFKPVKLRGQQKQNQSKKRHTKNYLNNIAGALNIHEEIMQRWITTNSADEQLMRDKKQFQIAFKKVINEVLDDELEDKQDVKHKKIIAKQLYRRFTEKSIKMSTTIDVSEIDMNLLVRENPIFIIAAYTSTSQYQTLQSLRDAVNQLIKLVYPIDEAQKIVSKLRLKRIHGKEGYTYRRKNPRNVIEREQFKHLPTHPKRYKDWNEKGGWSWFLGTEIKERNDLYSLEQAQKIVSKLRLKSRKEYHCRLKHPKNKSEREQFKHLPTHPERFKNWNEKGGWSWFLDAEIKDRSLIQNDLYSLEQTQKIVSKLRLKNRKEYRYRLKHPKNKSEREQFKHLRVWSWFLGKTNHAH